MNAGSLQEQIYDWLASHYRDGPQWNSEGFHCFKDCHPIIRSVLAMDALEGELSNGAWGQLLWNTFPNWRVVLDLAKDGYVSMSAARQVDAMPGLSVKLAAYENGCRAAMQRAGAGNFEKEFAGFTSIGYSDSKFEPQLAYLDPKLASLRERWLERNREVILRAIAA